MAAPTNENTNGLVRQYLPKGADLSPYSRRDPEKIAHSLNTRPRACLGFHPPPPGGYKTANLHCKLNNKGVWRITA